MRAPLTYLATAVSLLGFSAWAAGQLAEPPSNGTQAAATAAVTSPSNVRACDLLDLASAKSVIGTDTEHPGGDTERDTCIYSNAGVAMLTIMISSAEFYDQFTISPPHTPTSIGDRGQAHPGE